MKSGRGLRSYPVTNPHKSVMFSAMIIAAITHASTFSHAGATRSPIVARLPVNATKGTTRERQLKAQHDLAQHQQLRRAPVPRECDDPPPQG